MNKEKCQCGHGPEKYPRSIVDTSDSNTPNTPVLCGGLLNFVLTDLVQKYDQMNR